MEHLEAAYPYVPLRNKSNVHQEKPGPRYGTGLTYLDKRPAWWLPEMEDMSPRERFLLARRFAHRGYHSRKVGRTPESA